MADGHGADEHEATVSSIPGVDAAWEMGQAWLRYYMDFARAYSKTWDRMQSGQLSFSDLLQSMTTLWQSQYRAAQDVITAPFRQDTPQWRYFHFEKSEPNALVEHVQLSRQQDGTAKIKSTPLHIMGPGTTSIVDAVDATWEDDRRAIEMRFDANKLKSHPAGEYLGFIYNGAAASGPPLVIILLRIA